MQLKKSGEAKKLGAPVISQHDDQIPLVLLAAGRLDRNEGLDL